VKGSKTQVQLSAMAERAALLLTAKANESLILRLNTHARNLCFFGEQND
jgi:hypothetical protein